MKDGAAAGGRRLRFVVVACLLGLASFYVGTHVVTTRPAPPSNVQIVQGTETDTRLPDNAIDLALLVDVYHELWHPQNMLQSIRRSLKPNGELVLVEYRKEDPSIPIADAHRMSVADIRTEVEAEGFTFDRLVPGLPRQHIIVFRKRTGG